MRRLRLEVVASYPNRHFLDPIKLMPPDAFERRYWFFEGMPAFRRSLGWDIPQPFRLLRGSGGVRAMLAAIQALRKADVNMFYGLVMAGPWHLFLVIVSLYFGKPTFIMSEGLRHRVQSGWKRWLLAALCNRSNACLLACGDGAAEDYLGLGFDRWSYRRYGFAEVGAPIVTHASSADEIHLLSSGRLIPRKNMISLLRCLREIAPTGRIVVDLAGEGPERPQLEAEGRLLPPNIELRLHGQCPRERLSELFDRADIFVLPSLYDGWGVVVNEALAHHVPTLVSARVRAGLGFLVRPGVNGFVYQNDEEYRTHLGALLSDASLRERLRAGAQKIAEQWDINSMAARLAAVLAGQEVESIDGPLDLMHPQATSWWGHAFDVDLPPDPEFSSKAK
jgi:glycosyltransferase involved in cell wall biosynthesis